MNTKQAYQHCLSISKNHYENFPVASWILPRRMRLPTAAIYAFARRADDIADEGELTDAQRLSQLEQLAQQVAVERQRLGPALGHRRVGFVQVGGHEGEHQRARKG